jgi:hypothetical protein
MATKYRMADWSYTDPVICLAYDTKNQLYHPLIFALLPPERAKGYLNGRAWEYRGYYRNGFGSIELAQRHAREDMGPLMERYHTTGTLTYRLDDIFEWPGVGAPDPGVWCFPELNQPSLLEQLFPANQANQEQTSSAPGAPGELNTNP